jgi:molybdate transport system substrate-binding protein
MFKIKQYLLVAIVLLAIPVAATAEQVNLYAAGSLKTALSDVAKAFEQATGNTVAKEFGPSGNLRQKIEQGEKAHVFASANMEHPQSLVGKGQRGPVALFARNTMCAIAQPGLEVSAGTLLDVMLNPSVRVGMSTPKADPSGDYAWELFGKADKIRVGSAEALRKKALQLTGGPDSEKAPEGRNPYAWVMEGKKADLFLTYCTNAVLAKKELPQLQIVQIAPELSVGADYGLIVLDGAPKEAWRLAMFILGPEGQRILSSYGFMAEGVPAN